MATKKILPFTFRRDPLPPIAGEADMEYDARIQGWGEGRPWGARKGGNQMIAIQKTDIGKRVKWHAELQADGSFKSPVGTVQFGRYPLWRGDSTECLHIQWDDGQVTLPDDAEAMQFTDWAD